MKYAIGVDVGGSSAKLGVVNTAGEIVVRHQVPTPVSEEPARVARGYGDAIAEVLTRCQHMGISPVGIGLGMPGHISPDRRSAPLSNIHILDGFPLGDYLEERFRVPVEMDNDATAAALAEYCFGAGRGADRLLVVTVGTGIGAGLIINGQPQRPVRGCIGDPGHIIVDAQSQWQCGFGCRGCLETVASSLAIEREAEALARRRPGSRLVRQLDRDGSLSTAQVIEAARQGDSAARQVLEQAARWLGIGLASWCYFFDPRLILIGGGVSAAGDLLLAPLSETIQARTMPVYAREVRIDLACLGNDAGLIGAASLFLNDGGE
jgi:glucokinase